MKVRKKGRSEEQTQGPMRERRKQRIRVVYNEKSVKTTLTVKTRGKKTTNILTISQIYHGMEAIF